MPSQIDIANRALRLAGQNRITALTDDNDRALFISDAWPSVRDAELRKHMWRFATTRAELAADASAPLYGFAYQYTLPGDFLRLVQIGDTLAAVNLTNYRTAVETDWAIEGDKLLTDYAAPLKLRYVKRVEDVGYWDDLFAEMVAARIALEITPNLTESSPIYQRCMDAYQLARMEALRINAIEIPRVAPQDSTWIASRYS